MSRMNWATFGPPRRGTEWGDLLFCIVVGMFLAVLTIALAGCKPGESPPARGVSPAPRAVELPPPAPLPPGHSQTVVEEWIGGETHTHEKVTGTGAGAEAVGQDLTQAVDSSAPSASLTDGGGSFGGSIRSRLTALNPETLMSNPLLWVGIAGIVGAGVALYFGLRRAAIIAGSIGAGLIVAAMLPGWAWFIIAGVCAVGGAVYLYAEYKGKRSHEALRAVAAGVADLADMAPESYKLVKTRVAAHADTKDAKTIDAVKTADRL